MGVDVGFIDGLEGIAVGFVEGFADGIGVGRRDGRVVGRGEGGLGGGRLNLGGVFFGTPLRRLFLLSKTFAFAFLCN